MNNRLVARIGNSESGYSFAFAMGLILIFLVLGAALLTLVVNESTMVVRHYDSRRAYYLAEAGINEALFELNRSPAGDGVTTGTLTVGSQTGSYSTAYSQNTLTATATFPSSGGVTKTISVKVNPAAVSGSWSDMAAIAAEEIENIPAKMTIWNGSGDTDPDRLSLYSNEGLNINGYVLNYNQPLGGADHLGWAYSGGNLGPGSNVGTHFREASSALGMAFPTFDSSSYDNMIDNVGDTGTELPSTISGTQTYGPGIYYREGNLTISSATIQTDSSVTRDDPVYFVVEGKITVTNSTIGVANPTNLADPSLPPSAANPYGNWIRILVGDEDSRIQGTISNRTYINKEVRIYTRDEETHVRDYVTMDRGGLYFGDRRNKIQARNGTTTWLSQTSGTSNRLYATDFPDSSNGIAVGASGTVKYTSDGGTGWSATSTSISGSLRGVSFPNTGNAWAVGDGGSIWKSSNGGSTWSQQATGGSQLNGVSFADSNYGVAVGDGKTIRYTTNGGSTWQNAASTPGTSPDLSGVKLRASGANYIGWAVGSAEGAPARGTIWYTGDGGQTWTAQTTSSNRDFYGVSFVDANNGWISGASGTILRTTDGGTTWSSQSSDGYSGTARAVAAYDAHQSLSVGAYLNSTAALHTTNGGYAWDKMSMPSSTDLYGVSFVDKVNGWAVGDSGTILKYTGPSLYLRGTIFCRDEELELDSQSTGGEIFLEGAIAAGNEDDSIEFAGANHLIDVMFSLGAMPGSTDDGIGGAMVPSGATLDYSTWRES